MRNVILVTPGDSFRHNLHLKLLYNILQINGFTVLPFSFKKLWKYKKISIWHIHWIHDFYRGTYHSLGIHKSNLIISIFRFMIFLNHLLIVKILRVKVIWSIHNVCSPDSKETIFERIVIAILLQFSNRVTAFNEYIKKVIIDKFRYEKIILMRQGIYEDCYQEKIPKVKACKRLGVSENKFVLLMFGSLQPYKGADLLIHALANHKDDNLAVILAGRTNLNPSYGSYLKKLAEQDDRILIFDEYIAEPEVPYFYGAADYTIYPYRQIANSGALFLSFTFGVPSIISDKGGVKEVTSIVPETSILIKEPTIQNIIAAIIEAKNRPNRKNKMLIMQQRLSWRHLTNSILEVFNFT